MPDYNFLRSKKLNIDTPPQTRIGRFALDMHGRCGRFVWRLGSPVIKLALKYSGERHYVLLVSPNGEYYLQNPLLGNGEWRLPGGGASRSDKGDANLTRTRELAEEFGVTGLDLSKSVEVFSGRHLESGFYMTVSALQLGSKPIMSPHILEVARAGFFRPEELDIPVDPTIINAIRNYEQLP